MYKFGTRGSLEQHGFARNRFWVIDDDPPPFTGSDFSDQSSIDLLLKPSADDLRIWPHRYGLNGLEKNLFSVLVNLESSILESIQVLKV